MEYIKLRAQIEGVEFELDRCFFEAYYVLGVRSFFGVLVDEDCQPIFDEQEPKDHPGLLKSFIINYSKKQG
jgi:hypothetical protein